jgi:hypothetical protein
MRNLSLAIIALTVLLVSFFPKENVGNSKKSDPLKSPHGANFNISCTNCHTPKGWKVDKETFSFNHDSTAMPLKGQHAKTDCKLCHPTLVFAEAKTQCAQCHTDMHESSLGKDCGRCHTPSSWLVSNITQIHQQSRFPLVGVHAAADCYQCHKSETFNRFEVMGTECYSCHMDNYTATTQPNHVTAGFSTDCSICHNIFSKEWKGTGFNHDKFPLTLGHDIDECLKCHVNGNYTKISSECIDCHQPDYIATTNPNHVSANFSKDCITCHTTTPGWKPALFDHNKFPLTQGHNIGDCSKCHINGNYTNASSECISCHQPDYNATTNPNHASAHYSTNCTMCHTTVPGWKPAIFDHSKFPLIQGHKVDDCSKCHINGNYTNTSSECISCHQPDYNATTNPNHISANFSTNCATCHTIAPGWKPANFDHSKFPLTQGHNLGDCTKCHINGNYTNTSSECVSCHQTDYNATTNPNHASANFPTSCATCHTTAPGWKPAKFDHSKFPLTQGHNLDDCTKCHINGNYTNTSSECVSCHQTDYNATTNPKHSTLNFSTICTQCHTTAPGWKPASYTQHDALSFPIYSGKHRGTWSSCTDCHTNTSNYKVFNCLNCHEHNKTDMDSKHSGENGYSYNSTACFNCHPRGIAD